MSLHKTISFVKSTMRIVACIIGVSGGFYRDFESVLIAFAALGLAEILGIIEELGEK